MAEIASYSEQTYPLLTKFRCGLDPLERESLNRTIEPTDATSKAIQRQMIDALRAEAGEDAGDVSRAIALWTTKEKIDAMPKQINAWFAVEFTRWLRGVSDFNDPRITPWGNRDMLFIPEVLQYLREILACRADFQRKLVHLAVFWPRTLNDAYLYYKYIVMHHGWTRDHSAPGTRLAPDADDDNDGLHYMSIGGMLDFLDDFSQTSFYDYDLDAMARDFVPVAPGLREAPMPDGHPGNAGAVPAMGPGPNNGGVDPDPDIAAAGPAPAAAPAAAAAPDDPQQGLLRRMFGAFARAMPRWGMPRPDDDDDAPVADPDSDDEPDASLDESDDDDDAPVADPDSDDDDFTNAEAIRYLQLVETMRDDELHEAREAFGELLATVPGHRWATFGRRQIDAEMRRRAAAAPAAAAAAPAAAAAAAPAAAPAAAQAAAQAAASDDESDASSSESDDDGFTGAEATEFARRVKAMTDDELHEAMEAVNARLAAVPGHRGARLGIQMLVIEMRNRAAAAPAAAAAAPAAAAAAAPAAAAAAAPAAAPAAAQAAASDDDGHTADDARKFARRVKAMTDDELHEAIKAANARLAAVPGHHGATLGKHMLVIEMRKRAAAAAAPAPATRASPVASAPSAAPRTPAATVASGKPDADKGEEESVQSKRAREKQARDKELEEKARRDKATELYARVMGISSGSLPSTPVAPAASANDSVSVSSPGGTTYVLRGTTQQQFDEQIDQLYRVNKQKFVNLNATAALNTAKGLEDLALHTLSRAGVTAENAARYEALKRIRVELASKQSPLVTTNAHTSKGLRAAFAAGAAELAKLAEGKPSTQAQQDVVEQAAADVSAMSAGEVADTLAAINSPLVYDTGSDGSPVHYVTGDTTASESTGSNAPQTPDSTRSSIFSGLSSAGSSPESPLPTVTTPEQARIENMRQQLRSIIAKLPVIPRTPAPSTPRAPATPMSQTEVIHRTPTRAPPDPDDVLQRLSAVVRGSPRITNDQVKRLLRQMLAASPPVARPDASAGDAHAAALAAAEEDTFVDTLLHELREEHPNLMSLPVTPSPGSVAYWVQSTPQTQPRGSTGTSSDMSLGSDSSMEFGGRSSPTPPSSSDMSLGSDPSMGLSAARVPTPSVSLGLGDLTADSPYPQTVPYQGTPMARVPRRKPHGAQPGSGMTTDESNRRLLATRLAQLALELSHAPVSPLGVPGTPGMASPAAPSAPARASEGDDDTRAYPASPGTAQAAVDELLQNINSGDRPSNRKAQRAARRAMRAAAGAAPDGEDGEATRAYDAPIDEPAQARAAGEPRRRRRAALDANEAAALVGPAASPAAPREVHPPDRLSFAPGSVRATGTRMGGPTETKRKGRKTK